MTLSVCLHYFRANTVSVVGTLLVVCFNAHSPEGEETDDTKKIVATFKTQPRENCNVTQALRYYLSTYLDIDARLSFQMQDKIRYLLQVHRKKKIREDLSIV